MSAHLQAVIVAVIVTFALAYAALRFMPAAWRRSVARAASAWAQRRGLSEVDARRVEAKLVSGGACGSCDSCRACGPAVPGGPTTGRGTIPIRSMPR